MLKPPLDKTPYERDPRSMPVTSAVKDGLYVYVQDEHGIVWALPDGPHLHPKVLGKCSLALYAGDMTIRGGKVADMTNLSGTFQFDDPQGLRDVATALRRQGLEILPGAVRLFNWSGRSRPTVLE
jgi:hypothetical protein